MPPAVSCARVNASAGRTAGGNPKTGTGIRQRTEGVGVAPTDLTPFPWTVRSAEIHCYGKGVVSELFHVPLLGAVLQGGDGAGERADVARAAAEPVEDLPALQDGEAAFAVGAHSGVAAAGLSVGVRQAPALVGGEEKGPFTTGIALVRIEVEPAAVGDAEHVVGAGGGEVVGGAGQPVKDPDQPAVPVGQPLQVDPVVAMLAGVVPPVVDADPVGAHQRAVEQGEVAMRPGQRPQRRGQAAAQTGQQPDRLPDLAVDRGQPGVGVTACVDEPAPAEPGRGQAASARYADVPGGP